MAKVAWAEAYDEPVAIRLKIASQQAAFCVTAKDKGRLCL
jgi:hypothetical protein